MALELHFAHQTPAAWDDVRTDAEERAWVERIRAGDPAAFEALYRAYWERLYAFAFRYLRSKEDAEEIVQEVFFRIWRGHAHWVPAGAVRNYLYLAVRNAAHDRLERAAVASRWRVGQGEMAAEIDLEEADPLPRWNERSPSFPRNDPRFASCGSSTSLATRRSPSGWKSVRRLWRRSSLAA